jgi:hypothetical protein
MKQPFETMLRQAVKFAASGDDLARRAFRPGDAAHLKRWVEDGRAGEIYDKLFDGKFDYSAACLFITAILELRRLAESSDAFATAFALIDRAAITKAPKHVREGLRALADGQITPKECAAYLDSINETLTKKPRQLNSMLRAREKATRPKVIFCRVLSAGLHRATGRWHDAEVAALCEIALKCGDVTADAVRAARRVRH